MHYLVLQSHADIFLFALLNRLLNLVFFSISLFRFQSPVVSSMVKLKKWMSAIIWAIIWLAMSMSNFALKKTPKNLSIKSTIAGTMVKTSTTKLLQWIFNFYTIWMKSFYKQNCQTIHFWTGFNISCFLIIGIIKKLLSSILLFNYIKSLFFIQDNPFMRSYHLSQISGIEIIEIAILQKNKILSFLPW